LAGNVFEPLAAQRRSKNLNTKTVHYSINDGNYPALMDFKNGGR